MSITETHPTTADQKVLVGLDNTEEENILIAFLMGVEALRAGKEAVLWLTKDAVQVGIHGFVDDRNVDGAPTTTDLLAEFVESGGRLFACPVCVKLRDLGDSVWGKNVEVVGAPSVYDFTAGGALVFNY
jgi:predicted peroxiredoxin